MEHIFFRNLAGIPQKELYRTLQQIGAQFNAYTYQNVLHFILTVTPRYFQQGVALLTGLLAPLQATTHDVSLERERIQSEIREEESERSAQYSVIDFPLQEHLYPDRLPVQFPEFVQ